MVAFEVYLNGRKLTTAGAEDVGLLLAILRWRRDATGVEEADIEVCGQRDDDIHLIWKDVPLQRGDEIRLRLVEVGETDVDEPKAFLLRSLTSGPEPDDDPTVNPT